MQHDRAGRQGRAGLPAPGRPRHRPGQQAARLRLQEKGLDTVEANVSWASPSTSATTASAARSSATWACSELRIMTNNPKKIYGIEGYGLSVVEEVPHQDRTQRTQPALPGNQEAQDGPQSMRTMELHACVAPALRLAAREGRRARPITSSVQEVRVIRPIPPRWHCLLLPACLRLR